MRISPCTLLLPLALAVSSFSASGCSAAAYGSQEAFTSGLAGGAVGSGIGYLIGDRIGNKSQNIAVNGAIGAGLGLLAGAAINERNIQLAKQREIVVREARLIGKTQMELDKLREELNESTSWGRNEVKPWDQRYTADDYPAPFQGSTGYKHPQY